MNPKMMALQGAMEDPSMAMPPEAPPEMAPPAGGDIGSAVMQAMDLLMPFAAEPGIQEVLALLEGTAGGPPADVAEDPSLMPMDEPVMA